jgi:hypothetical protein
VLPILILCGSGCGSGFWGGQRPSLAHYITGMGPMDGATAAGGRSCCLSSHDRCRPERASHVALPVPIGLRYEDHHREVREAAPLKTS